MRVALLLLVTVRDREALRESRFGGPVFAGGSNKLKVSFRFRQLAARPLLAEAVEELLNKPFSAKIGEHCQIGESLSY